MNWHDSNYESSKLVLLAERLNKCRESKLMLELELSNEEFNNKYISKRKSLTKEKARTRMLFVGIASIVIIAGIAGFISCVVAFREEGYSISSTLGMIFCLLLVLFGMYPCVRLWIPEIRMIKKLSTNNKDAEKGVISFDTEKERSNEKVSILKKQLDELTKEIEALECQRREEEALLKARIIAEEEKKLQTEADSKFKLNKKKAGELQYIEVIDLYDREIRRCKEELNRLEVEKEMLRREKNELNQEFESLKKRAFTYFITLLVLAFLHECFEGAAYAVIGLIIGVGLVAGFIYLATASEKTIVRYLVEHNNDIIRDYAFVKGLEPISKRENRVLVEIIGCKEWLKEFEGKKKVIQQELDDLNDWRDKNES